MKKYKQTLMLLAGIFALLAGALFFFLPGHTDVAWRRGIGSVWFVTGCWWMAAWMRRLRHNNGRGTLRPTRRHSSFCPRFPKPVTRSASVIGSD